MIERAFARVEKSGGTIATVSETPVRMYTKDNDVQEYQFDDFLGIMVLVVGKLVTPVLALSS
ncbi:uncharacterized protein BJX67DRAFT_347489 [Aspergillus lucknowensis]|uniref:Uncharacterized protein n=1 Tax=Aspergillus lucknowensis TaxID=176173 RepID=A0ABR4LYB8_9EURO